MINSKFRTRTVSKVGRRESDRGSWQYGQLFSVQAGWWTWVLTVVLSPILPSVKSGDRRITVSQVAVVITLYYFRTTLTGMRTHQPAGSFLVLNRNAKLAPHLLSFPPFFLDHLCSMWDFSSLTRDFINHVWMWELDYKESWALKNWCFWTAVLEKTLESPLNYKDSQPVHPKGDQFLVFIGRTDVETEAPILWPPDAKSWLIWKDPDAGKDWEQMEKGMAEDEIVGWHHQLNGHEFGWTLGVGDGQGGLVCCGSWGYKESDTTEWLNWT